MEINKVLFADDQRQRSSAGSSTEEDDESSGLSAANESRIEGNNPQIYLIEYSIGFIERCSNVIPVQYQYITCRYISISYQQLQVQYGNIKPHTEKL